MKLGGAIHYTQHFLGGIEYRQAATGNAVIEALSPFLKADVNYRGRLHILR